MSLQAARVEEKLYQNRYLVDVGKPHIVIEPHEKPSKNLLGDDDALPGRLLCREFGRPGGDHAGWLS